MKKYYKPVSKEIVLDGQELLAGSFNGEDGTLNNSVGSGEAAKRNNLIIIDDEEDF